MNRMILFPLVTVVLVAGCADETMPSVAAARTQESVSSPSAQAEAAPEEQTQTDPPEEIAVGDWPIFLGPHGTGESDETGLLDVWPESGPRIVWETVIGKGYSSP